ncbi:MAG: ATP-dependent DNA ligase [Candidatus Thorarchaeota archaeon]|nr:ATP-dependent DNA ligase [Candidatus Thorarchaeota archaeon]
MYYKRLAESYAEIESISGLHEKIRIFSQVLKEANPSEVGQIVALTLGKLHPDWREQPEIGVAERIAIQVVAAAASVPESRVLQVLTKTGDIGLTAEELLGQSAQGTLMSEDPTVSHVYSALEHVSQALGQKSAKEKVTRLVGLLTDLSPTEARYVIRTITGDLRLGLGHMSIIDALASAFADGKSSRDEIERAFNVCSDLAEVARLLAERGISGISAIKAEVGRPIGMMAAKRLSDAREILEKSGGRALVEYKYDGERMQIHKDGDKVILYSRRQEVITSQYPDVVEMVRTRIVANRCIIEGECVGIDPVTGRLRPFQELMRRRRKTDVAEMSKQVPVALFLFDILYLEDRDVTGQALPERRQLLEKVVKQSDSVRLTTAELTDDPARLDSIFHTALSEGMEGVIAKAVHKESTYQAGARSWLWIKLKASYKEGMADSFDFVVVGAMHGRGKRTGVYGAILASVYDSDTDTFPTVCKIGTGFTDDMLTEFRDRLEKHRIPARHPKVLSDMDADVWFEPAEVIEVLGDEITVSPAHPAARGHVSGGGLAIRFPRFTGRWRDDKSPDQATTVDELVEAFERQRGTKESRKRAS